MVFLRKTLPSETFGFTLMELLISITIFLIITGMVIINFHAGRYRDELVGAAEAISTSMREMQTATNAGDVVECNVGEFEPPTNGFGVNLAASAVAGKLFGDCPGAAPYTYDGTDVEVKTVSWSARAPVTKLEVDGVAAAAMDILFSVGSEKVRLNGNDTKTIGLITVTHSKSLRQAEVQVNAITGQVFITYL